MTRTPHNLPVISRRPLGASRRAVLRTGLAMPPALLLGGLSWNRLLRLAGVLSPSGASAATQSTPACVVTPQLTEGPYFVDEHLYRSDIRSDPADGSVKEGVPLRLTLRVSQVGDGGCSPLAGAAVDIWQCDALGVYSDVRDPGFNTVGHEFLRGAQFTDESGQAEFLTIYPGWYEGRTVHIHFKVRTDPGSGTGYEFTSQLFFDDALTDVVHARDPYAAKGMRTLRNDGDDIYRQSGGLLTLQLVEDGDGFAGTFDVGVDLSAPATPAGPGGPGGPPPSGTPVPRPRQRGG